MEYLLITILVTVLFLSYNKKESFIFEKQKQDIMNRIRAVITEYVIYVVILIIVISTIVSVITHIGMNKFFGPGY